MTTVNNETLVLGAIGLLKEYDAAQHWWWGSPRIRDLGAVLKKVDEIIAQDKKIAASVKNAYLTLAEDLRERYLPTTLKVRTIDLPAPRSPEKREEGRSFSIKPLVTGVFKGALKLTWTVAKTTLKVATVAAAVKGVSEYWCNPNAAIQAPDGSFSPVSLTPFQETVNKAASYIPFAVKPHLNEAAKVARALWAELPSHWVDAQSRLENMRASLSTPTDYLPNLATVGVGVALVAAFVIGSKMMARSLDSTIPVRSVQEVLAKAKKTKQEKEKKTKKKPEPPPAPEQPRLVPKPKVFGLEPSLQSSKDRPNSR